MIGIIIIGIIAFLLIKFFIDYEKDNDDLNGQLLNEKFAVIVDVINEAAFNRCGTVKILDKREFNLYDGTSNQFVKFQYGTGHLTIIWRYKYFQKEIIHQKQIIDVRNLSIFEQQKIGDQMVKEMAIVVAKHKIDVLGNI